MDVDLHPGRNKKKEEKKRLKFVRKQKQMENDKAKNNRALYYISIKTNQGIKRFKKKKL